jgi:hypothetical protein
MPGKKITKNLTGSNLYTNNTCQFGSMAGLNPTVGVRPNVTGIHGYKTLLVSSAASAASCGVNKSYADNKLCAAFLGKKAITLYNPVRNRHILG